MLDYLEVNMGMIRTGKAPEKLGTVLGSCIGLSFYEKSRKIGVLSHIMLPDSGELKNIIKSEEKGKYADTAIEEMINIFKSKNIDLKNIEIKMVGGAQMFDIKRKNEITKIGKRNEEAIKKLLNQMGMRIKAEVTGGSIGRKIIFDLESGSIMIMNNFSNNGVKII